MSDPLDDFLAPLLGDIPEFLPTSFTMPPLPPLPSISAPNLTFNHALNHQFTCQWVLTPGAPFVCGVPISPDPKLACAHFRSTHDVRGNERVVVRCYWRDCRAPPMQRGSMIRHLLAVHLGLLKWQCEACGKVFSRRGTGHACIDVENGANQSG